MNEFLVQVEIKNRIILGYYIYGYGYGLYIYYGIIYCKCEKKAVYKTGNTIA